MVLPEQNAPVQFQPGDAARDHGAKAPGRTDGPGTKCSSPSHAEGRRTGARLAWSGALLVLVLLFGLLAVAGTAAAQNAYSASDDGTVRKLDSSGSEVWSFDGTGEGNELWTVTTDVDGNVYAGDTKGNVFKLDPTGSEVWSFAIPNAPKALSVAIDGDGNVYVGDENGDVTKLDSTGNKVWTSTPSSGSKVHAVSPDGDGNVYAGTNAKEVVKLDSAGSEVWTSTAPSGQVHAVTVNPSGDVFTGDENGEILKILSSGSQVWSFTPHSNKIFDLAFDGKGSLYSASEDKTVKKIDPSGPTEVWSFTDPDGKKAFGLAIDSDRHVHYSSEAGKVFKLETDGSGTLWSFTGHTNQAKGVAVDPGEFVMSTDGTAPTVSSITTLDRDGDGKVDGANVVFSESIDDSTVTASDWSIGGQAADAFSTTVDGDSDADDDRIQLRITTDGNEVSGTDAKDVTYTQGTTEDLAGHKLADVASGDVTEADGAKPVVSSVTTLDRDTDGNVDGADVVFSEAIDDSTITASDWSIGGTATEAVSTTVDGDSDADDDRVQLQITTDASEVSGTDAKDVTYSQGSTADLAANKLASVASGDVSEADGAKPTITDLEIFDTDADGKIDKVVVSFSENVDTDDGSAPVAPDFGTIALPDGSTADLSGASFTDPGGSSSTVTITGVTGQSTANTATGSTGISGDLSANWADGAGNSLVSTLDDESVTDSAGPTFVSVTTADNDADGKVDELSVVYSEAIKSGSVEDADLSIGSANGLVGSLGSSSSDDGDDTVLFAISEGSSSDTGATPTLAYAQAGGSSNKVQDAGGNLMADDTSDAATDGAAPVRTAVESKDTDGDGQVDRIDVTYSEPLSGTAEVGDYTLGGNDASSTSLDSAAISGSTVQLGVTGPSDDTGLDLTVDYDKTAGTADSITDGSNAAASFTGASVADAAPPRVKTIVTADRDGDGDTDAAEVTFTEPIDDSTIVADDSTIGGTAADSVSTTVDGDSDADDEKVELRLTLDSNEVSGTDAKDVTYTQDAPTDSDTADLAGNLLPDVASGDVTETAENSAPSASDDSATVDEDDVVQIDVLADDSDPDGDTLSVDSATDPAHGTATVQADGTIKYEPDANFHGSDSFDYTITDGSLTDTATVSVTVDDVNDDPTAAAGSDQTVGDDDGDGEEVVALDGSGSSDVDGSVEGYSWTLGGAEIATGEKPTVTLDVGEHTITLTVTDDDGATATDEVFIDVDANGDPTAAFSFAPSNPEAGETVIFTDESTDGDGTVASWSWRFGDGAKSTDKNPEHVYTAAGSHRVRLTVTDSGGATDVERATIVVDAGSLAVVALDGPDEVAAGATVDYAVIGEDAHGNAVDMSQDTTSYTAPTTPGPVDVCHTAEGVTGCTTVQVVPGPAATLEIQSRPVDAVATSPTTVRYQATALDVHGNPVALDSATDVRWRVAPGGGSFEDDVLTTGDVAGLYAVRARLASDRSVTDAVRLRVLPGPVASFAMSPADATAFPGSSIVFRVEATDAAGNERVPPKMVWSLDGDDIGELTPADALSRTGRLHVDAPGSAVVTVRNPATGVSATATVTVPADAPEVARLEIAPREATVASGSTQRFRVVGFAADGTRIGDVPASFAVADRSIGGVTQRGVFTARVAGTTQITATTWDRTATATVTVVPGPVAQIGLGPQAAFLPTGGSADFEARVLDAWGNPVPSADVNWSLDDPTGGRLTEDGTYRAGDTSGVALVTVESGIVSAEAVVYVQTDDGMLTRVTRTTLPEGDAVGLSIAVSAATNGSRVNVTPPAGAGTDAGGIDRAEIVLGDDVSNVTITIESWPGSLATLPEDVDRESLLDLLESDIAPPRPGLYFSVSGTEDGETMSAARLNEVVSRMTVEFRIPATYFEAYGLDPNEVHSAEWEELDLVHTDLGTELLIPEPLNGSYRYETRLESFSAFGVMAPPVRADGGDGFGDITLDLSDLRWMLGRQILTLVVLAGLLVVLVAVGQRREKPFLAVEPFQEVGSRDDPGRAVERPHDRR